MILGSMNIELITAPFAQFYALLCFATRGFHFATRKTKLDTPWIVLTYST